MKPRLLWAGMFLLVGLSSCNPKDYVNPRDNSTINAEMKADPTFTWSTTKEVTVEVKGLPLPVSIFRKLTLSTDDGAEFYAGTQKMEEDFIFTVELPNHIQVISMQYGAIEKEEDLSGSKVSFDYLPISTDNGLVE